MPPASIPVKRTPKINDLIKDTEVKPAQVSEDKPDINPRIVEEEEPLDRDVVSAGIRINRSFEETSPTTNTADDKFAIEWKNMFELLFREIPTIYYPLKDFLPDFDGKIIRVTVKNELMKETFESRVRLALEYLRSHLNPMIDNIEVELAKTEEKSKLIYDTQDKINDLHKENADLPEFLKILQLSPKDI